MGKGLRWGLEVECEGQHPRMGVEITRKLWRSESSRRGHRFLSTHDERLTDSMLYTRHKDSTKRLGTWRLTKPYPIWTSSEKTEPFPPWMKITDETKGKAHRHPRFQTPGQEPRQDFSSLIFTLSRFRSLPSSLHCLPSHAQASKVSPMPVPCSMPLPAATYPFAL